MLSSSEKGMNAKEKKMSGMIIEEAKCGVADGGVACGPVPGPVVGAVRFSDGESSQWLYLVEIEDIPSFYLAEEDIYDKLIDNSFGEEFNASLNEHRLPEFFGIELSSEYTDVLRGI